MYKEGQILKIKEDQDQDGLPAEVMVTKVEGEAVHITSESGTYESTAEILDTFYVAKEEFTLLTMPKMTIDALDKVVGLFDIYAATQSPLAGMQVKAELLSLKESIARVSGLKSSIPAVESVLGKKLS